MMVETLYAPDYAAIDFAFGFSVLSAAGSLFIIGNWLCNSSARRLFFLRLIVFLAIANLFSSLSYVMSFVEWRVLALHRDDYAAETWCIVQATLLVFFEDVRIAPAPEMYLPASQRHVCRQTLTRLATRSSTGAWAGIVGKCCVFGRYFLGVRAATALRP